MKKSQANRWGIWICLLGAAGAALFSIQRMRNRERPDSLKDVVHELAKATPMVIDYETRMDRILVTGEKTVTCYYTLLNVTKEEVDTAEFVRMMRPGLLDRYNQHPALEWFRDRNIQIQHAYYGRDAQWVATIQVPADVEK